MDIAHLQQLALEIRDSYRGQGKKLGEKPWTATQYCSALSGDVGDLSKLVMMYDGYRIGTDVQQKIAHELSDCLWAILVIAHMTNTDLASAFTQTMNELRARIGSDHATHEY